MVEISTEEKSFPKSSHVGFAALKKLRLGIQAWDNCDEIHCLSPDSYRGEFGFQWVNDLNSRNFFTALSFLSTFFVKQKSRSPHGLSGNIKVKPLPF